MKKIFLLLFFIPIVFASEYTMNYTVLPFNTTEMLNLSGDINTTSFITYNGNFIIGASSVFFNDTSMPLYVDIYVPNETIVGIHDNQVLVFNTGTNVSVSYSFKITITNLTYHSPETPIFMDINKFKYVDQCVYKQPYDLKTEISLPKNITGSIVSWVSKMGITDNGTTTVTQDQQIVTLVTHMKNLSSGLYEDVVSFYKTDTNISSNVSLIFAVSDSGICAQPVFSKETCITNCRNKYGTITVENYKAYAACIGDCEDQGFLQIESANKTITIYNETEKIIIQERYKPVIPVDSADKIVDYQKLSENYNVLSTDIVAKMNEMQTKLDAVTAKQEEFIKYPELTRQLMNTSQEYKNLKALTIKKVTFYWTLFVIVMCISGFFLYKKYEQAHPY